MRNIKCFCYILFFVVGCSVVSFGQVSQSKGLPFHLLPIEISVGNFSVGVPFSKLIVPNYYPCATFGTEFYYRKRPRHSFYQTAKVGTYVCKYSTSSVFLITETGYRLLLPRAFFFDGNVGLGYSHLFRPRSLYQWSGNDYEHVRDLGVPSLMGVFSFSLGYRCLKRSQSSIEMFARYGTYLQLFYNPDIPVLPQNSVQLGIRFQIHQP